MDNSTITVLEEVTEAEEVNEILKEFNTQNAQQFTFPGFDFSQRQRLWKALFQKLGDNSMSRCHIACLETVRILSRDKPGLNDIINRDMIDIILRLAGLVTEEEAYFSTNSQFDARVIVEAQKILSNLVFNSPSIQKMCCSSSCLEGIILRLRTYKDPEVPYEVKFFDMRLLFLLTAFCAEIRPRLCNELHGLTYLMEVLDLILKTSAENHSCFGNCGNRPRTGRYADTPCLNDNEADLACEVLKILFNLTIHVDKHGLDEEEEAHFMRLVSVLHDILVCPTHTKEKREELQSHTVHLLTNMPPNCYEELLMPLSEGAVGGYDNKDLEYESQNMEAIVILLNFLEKRLDKPLQSLRETLSPILICLCECCRSVRTIRKFLRARVLPPLRDVYNRPEQGETLRNKLCRLLTSPVTDIKDLVADFLFVLCKENTARLIKYTGFGNAAGLIANRGLMLCGRGKGNYSSESEDSETEEYREVKDRINPVIGCYEEPKPDPLADMSEEQKEYEAIQLVTLMEEISRKGIQPMKIGDDGKPHPVRHILELQEGLSFPPPKGTDYDSDSD